MAPAARSRRLALALQGNYEPAGRDGKGVASTLLFRIQFKLAQ
jgi:hypothetical protein